MYFIYMYEDKTLKPIDIIASRERGMRESDGGTEPKQCSL
jgi:hypothetical protein